LRANTQGKSVGNSLKQLKYKCKQILCTLLQKNSGGAHVLQNFLLLLSQSSSHCELLVMFLYMMPHLCLFTSASHCEQSMITKNTFFSSNFQLLMTDPSLRLPLSSVLSHEWIVNSAVCKAESTAATGCTQKPTV
jgi:hypothetical protein